MLTRLRSAGRVLRRDPAFGWLCLRVYVLLVVMRGVIRVLPLRHITRRLGAAGEETPTNGVSPAQLRYAQRIGAAILKVAPHTPTESNCYPQALTAHWLLERRNVPTTVYYGAAFEPGQPALEAHVWVRCGPLVVTGGGPLGRRFQPLHSFARLDRDAAHKRWGSDDATTRRPLSHPER